MLAKCDKCSGDCKSCEKFAERNFNLPLVEVKRKVASKYVEPDMSAIKLLAEFEKEKKIEINIFDGLSNEEIIQKKIEILKALNDEVEV